MRILIVSLALLLAACQSNAPYSSNGANCGPGGMGCRQGPMPFGDIDGAVGGSGPN
jgi:hypothetical protein